MQLRITAVNHALNFCRAVSLHSPVRRRRILIRPFYNTWLVAVRRVALVCILLGGARLTGEANAYDQPVGVPLNSVAEATAEADGAAVVTYDQSYFAQFNAITAEDLLRRIPGIQDLLGDQGGGSFGRRHGGRGFGSTGPPILFNGRRLSGKTNNPLSALRRIQARQVVRIEVIRGSVPGLDVRIGDEGRLVNVVLEDDVATGFGSWEVGAEYFTNGKWRARGKVSYAGDLGRLIYSLSADIDPRFFIRYADYTFVLPPDPAPFGRIDLVNRTNGTNYTGTAALTYSFANGDVANLNGRYADEPRVSVQPVNSYTVLSPENEIFTGSTLLIQDHGGDVEWELGGDYEHAFSDGDSMRALFVISSDRRPSDTNFFRTQPSGQEIHYLHQVVKSNRTERILRGYYTWAVAPGHSVEISGEVALNALDQQNLQFKDAGGTLLPVALFNSDSKVKEMRFESFTRYSWQVSPKLYLEGALDTEYSRLRQRGSDVRTSRSFIFVKPRLDARYDLGARTQIRGRVLRTVSQLNFSNFVSSVSTRDVRIGVIQAGNPGLVPEKTWTFEVTGEHRLADDQGVVSLRTFYNDIADAIDKILLAPDVAGAGNIGGARSYGAELKLGLRLDRLGLSGASIDASGTVQDSSVRDSFTLRRRPLQWFSNYNWSVSFRHDTDWRNLAYGATFTGSDARFGSDIDFTQSSKSKPDVDVFVEMRAAALTFRLEAKELLSVITRDRLQYIGNRANGNLQRQEVRHDTFEKIFKFIVKSTF